MSRPDIKFGHYRPTKILTNEEIESWGVEIGDKVLTGEAVYNKTGIVSRRVASKGESALTMGIQAASQVVSRGDRWVQDVIFSTSYPTGENHALQTVQALDLPLTRNGSFLNVNAACSGLAVALAHMGKNRDEFEGRDSVIVTSEHYSPTLPDLRENPDPSLSQTIFGDEALAMRFVLGEGLKILAVNEWTSSPEEAQSLKMPIDPDLKAHPNIEIPVPQSETGKFWMNGRKVYTTVVGMVPGLIIATLNEAGIDLHADPKKNPKGIIHQGSNPMVDGVANRIPCLEFIKDVAEGNTSSASIPRALYRAIEEDQVKSGDRIVFAGFGAGMHATVVVAQLR